MSDNTTLPIGSGGDTIRTLDRTGTGAPKTEVVQLDLGAGSTESLAIFPLPTALTDVEVDDDGYPYFSLSDSTMDALNILFWQLQRAMNPYGR